MPHELAARLPARDLHLLHAYAAKRRLPHQRIELQLAHIAQLLDVHLGGAQNARLGTYLLQPEPPEAQDSVQEAALEEFFR